MKIHWFQRLFVRPMVGCLLLSGFAWQVQAAEKPGEPHGEIVWDTYGVPHVFAKNETGLFWGFGYAQMEGHGDLLLRLYGESRGRAAEYWGAKYEAQDRYFAANDVAERAKLWYGQQTPEMKADVDAFAAGIDAYAKEHPEKLAAEVKVVLPVSGVDVIAHWERVMEFQYIASMGKAMGRGVVAEGRLGTGVAAGTEVAGIPGLKGETWGTQVLEDDAVSARRAGRMRGRSLRRRR